MGDGGWGTTLAILLHNKGHRVTLWGAFPEYVSYLRRNRINKKFLPDIKIPLSLEITSDLCASVASRDLIVLAIPSQYMRRILKRIGGYRIASRTVFVSVTKGLEAGSLLRMSQVIQEELGKVRLSVLSGPTIAYEVARGIPSTAVVASYSKSLRRSIAKLFNTDRFRIYTNDDMIGTEIGGSLKNVIAIACGISDGLGFGTNAKAALLSRGLAEISRLGKRMGAKVKTFWGVSGLGDLVTTCVSPFSRNRYLGEQIGRGRTVRQIISKMRMVAEGFPTAKAAYGLSNKYKVEMPIAREVYLVLYRDKNPERAVQDLMTRRLREE